MLTTFPKLPQEQMQQIIQLVKAIVKSVHPNKIICWGHRTTIMSDWNCFSEEPNQEKEVHPTYDLLIIVDEDEKRPEHEIIQAAEQKVLLLGCEVTVIVQSLSAANKALENGNRFISNVYQNGILIYDRDGDPLSVPSVKPDLEIVRSKIEADWNRCFDIAQCFLKKAQYCFDNGWYEQGTFDLHQSAQHACMAILRAYSGYRSTTHNLSRLLGLIASFSYQPLAIFPCVTKEETNLFNTLNRAYSDARYNEKYLVPKETALILLRRVEDLLGIIQQLYEGKRISLKSSHPISFPLNAANESV